MKRLIKDKDIILDGSAPRYAKEHEAFEKLEIIEDILDKYKINDLSDLIKICEYFTKPCEKVAENDDLTTKKYSLDDLVPCDEWSVIYVVGYNHYLTIVGPEEKITWRELIERSAINFKERHSLKTSLMMIVENLERGIIYKFGNYDSVYVYEQGTTLGYGKN